MMLCSSTQFAAGAGAGPSVSFIDSTPKAGGAAGQVVTAVDWANCPAAGNTVEVAMFQVMADGTKKALSTKSVVNVGASGAKTWTFTGLTTGIKVVANATVYDTDGKQIASVNYTPDPPVVVP
jgi:hypothetical protein